MKPDWDALGKEYADSPSVIIADVDCTAGGESLCKKHGVSGYPTIKTFEAGSDEGEAYEGGRDLDSLKKHAASLGPSCSIDHKDLCSAEDLPKLEKYVGPKLAVTMPCAAGDVPSPGRSSFLCRSPSLTHTSSSHVHAPLSRYAAMSAERRNAKVTKLKNAIAKEEARHEKVQKSLSVSRPRAQSLPSSVASSSIPSPRLLAHVLAVALTSSMHNVLAIT